MHSFTKLAVKIFASNYFHVDFVLSRTSKNVIRLKKGSIILLKFKVHTCPPIVISRNTIGFSGFEAPVAMLDFPASDTFREHSRLLCNYLEFLSKEK